MRMYLMMTLVSEKGKFYHDIEQINQEVGEHTWANFITKDDLKYLLKGGIINDCSDGEYAHPLALTKEAIDFINGVQK